MASRKAMRRNLVGLGLRGAIADSNASTNGYPAILLRWNGKEEYYTGQDIYEPGDDPADQDRARYQSWLLETFK